MKFKFFETKSKYLFSRKRTQIIEFMKYDGNLKIIIEFNVYLKNILIFL